MVKIVKLPIQYEDINLELMDVFMVEYSDNVLFNKGEFILDLVDANMTSEFIENYINVEMCEFDIEERKKHIEDFIYRIDHPFNGKKVNSFLKELYRDIQLNKILQ